MLNRFTNTLTQFLLTYNISFTSGPIVEETLAKLAGISRETEIEVLGDASIGAFSNGLKSIEFSMFGLNSEEADKIADYLCGICGDVCHSVSRKSESGVAEDDIYEFNLPLESLDKLVKEFKKGFAQLAQQSPEFIEKYQEATRQENAEIKKESQKTKPNIDNILETIEDCSLYLMDNQIVSDKKQEKLNLICNDLIDQLTSIEKSSTAIDENVSQLKSTISEFTDLMYGDKVLQKNEHAQKLKIALEDYLTHQAKLYGKHNPMVSSTANLFSRLHVDGNKIKFRANGMIIEGILKGPLKITEDPNYDSDASNDLDSESSDKDFTAEFESSSDESSDMSLSDFEEGSIPDNLLSISYRMK